MTFDEYQKQSAATAHVDDAYVGTLMEPTIWAMGVAGEAGEVLEKWKKIVAYQKGEIDATTKSELAKEMGDVLWYMASFASSLELSLEDIAVQNIKKLQDRQKRDVIKGAGDNR